MLTKEGLVRLAIIALLFVGVATHADATKHNFKGKFRRDTKGDWYPATIVIKPRSVIISHNGYTIAKIGPGAKIAAGMHKKIGKSYLGVLAGGIATAGGLISATSMKDKKKTAIAALLPVVGAVVTAVVRHENRIHFTLSDSTKLLLQIRIGGGLEDEFYRRARDMLQ